MCDYHDCYRPPYVEVFKIKEHAWSYLCKKHYHQEWKKHGNNYGWYELTLKERIIQGLIYYLRLCDKI